MPLIIVLTSKEACWLSLADYKTLTECHTRLLRLKGIWCPSGDPDLVVLGVCALSYNAMSMALTVSSMAGVMRRRCDWQSQNYDFATNGVATLPH